MYVNRIIRNTKSARNFFYRFPIPYEICNLYLLWSKSLMNGGQFFRKGGDNIFQICFNDIQVGFLFIVQLLSLFQKIKIRG